MKLTKRSSEIVRCTKCMMYGILVVALIVLIVAVVAWAGSKLLLIGVPAPVLMVVLIGAVLGALWYGIDKTL